jgi:hypothetical protein
MAIKGKKKSGSRGSQARRRPAAAPRPIVGAARQKTPWYNTATGRVVAALLVVLVVAGIGSAIAINRSNAREQDERREAVEDYVGEVASIAQSTATPIGEMSAIAPGAPADQLEALKENAEGWSTDIEAAASRVAALQAEVPPEVDGLHPYFQQYFSLYSNTAKLLIDAADAEGKQQADLLTRATELRGNAEAIWGATTQQLDDELIDELGGDPSGLTSPAMAAASGAIPTTPGGGGGQGGGGQGGGGDGG